ncbi:MAG TPA: oligosaccharide flippase family protein [Candidatus Limnocylindria bacterium]|nr:oligosaccharide flippase family protein [Candidatus Limnocylindria bacterium]
MIDRARANAGALWLLAATTMANVLGYGYQVVMARLLRPEDYAILIALFGVLILESISSQVIQSATAKLAAQYRARGDEAALHLFVRRWSVRIVIAVAALALLVVLLAGPISSALALPAFTVVLLGASLFFAAVLTFALGLLQGLARFGWMGSVLIVQAGARLTLGVALVAMGTGVYGAFTGATAAVGVSLLFAIVPLLPLLRAARGATALVELGRDETRFFALAAIVLLAYAALTNVDAVLARTVLAPGEAGAYAGAVTLGKVVLFAPIAVGYLLLERTSRAHARGEPTERALFLALGFVLATSGLVALAYVVAPAFFVALVVGDQYPATVAVAPIYGIAALANALLSLWIAYFVGRGEMRVGFLLAAAVIAEIALLLLVATDALSVARIVLVVALATQAAAVATFVVERSRVKDPAEALTPR